MASVLYKYVLLVLDILSVIIRYLAYFLHFDPPTFDLIRRTARVYLKPVAMDITQTRELQTHKAHLQEHILRVTRMNTDLENRLRFAESRTAALEALLSQQEQTSRQRLLSVLSGRPQPRPRPRAASSLLELHTAPTGVHTKQTEASARITMEKLRNSHTLSRHLLVLLLLFRRSMRESKRRMFNAMLMLEESHAAQDRTVQHLLIELLTARTAVREMCAEIRMKTSLAMIISHTQLMEMKRQRAEYNKVVINILVQMLTFRKRLFQCLSTSAPLSPKSASLPTNIPIMHREILIAELESLRISEAQARAEKDSMATCLSDVLASLCIKPPNGYDGVHDEPIVGLVLALAFMWKAQHRTNTAKLKQQEPANLKRVGNAVDESGDSGRVSIQKAKDLGLVTTSQVSRAHNPVLLANRPSIPSITAPSRSHSSSSLSAPPPAPQFPPGIYLPTTSRSPSRFPEYHNSPAFHQSLPRPYPKPICPPQRSSMMSRGGPTLPDFPHTAKSEFDLIHDELLLDKKHIKRAAMIPHHMERL